MWLCPITGGNSAEMPLLFSIPILISILGRILGPWKKNGFKAATVRRIMGRGTCRKKYMEKFIAYVRRKYPNAEFGSICLNAWDYFVDSGEDVVRVLRALRVSSAEIDRIRRSNIARADLISDWDDFLEAEAEQRFKFFELGIKSFLFSGSGCVGIVATAGVVEKLRSSGFENFSVSNVVFHPDFPWGTPNAEEGGVFGFDLNAGTFWIEDVPLAFELELGFFDTSYFCEADVKGNFLIEGGRFSVWALDIRFGVSALSEAAEEDEDEDELDICEQKGGNCCLCDVGCCRVRTV